MTRSGGRNMSNDEEGRNVAVTDGRGEVTLQWCIDNDSPHPGVPEHHAFEPYAAVLGGREDLPPFSTAPRVGLDIPLPNGCWLCIGCGVILPKRKNWNQCAECDTRTHEDY